MVTTAMETKEMRAYPKKGTIDVLSTENIFLLPAQMIVNYNRTD